MLHKIIGTNALYPLNYNGYRWPLFIRNIDVVTIQAQNVAMHAEIKIGPDIHVQWQFFSGIRYLLMMYLENSIASRTKLWKIE